MNPLHSLSTALADAVALAAPSLVGVDDGSRLTATGIVWDPRHIVTTSHGTERDDDLAIVTPDSVRLPATLVGRDPDSDIALLRIETDLPPLARLPEGSEPRVGELAIAAGRPGHWGLTATLGMVASVQLTQTGGSDEYIVTTDADLYPGVSGGALLTVEGKLIGLLNRLYGHGLGVALGAPLVARVVAALQAHGRVPRGYLGVRMQRVVLPDPLRVTHSLAQESGLLVVHVEPGSSADGAGVLLGDTLIALDGVPLIDVTGLRDRLLVGKTFTLAVLRGGALQTITGTVHAAPA